MTEALRLVGHPLAVRLSMTLLHFVWQGAALAAAAAVLLAALRKASPATRYLALLGVLAAMALCPVVTFALAGRAPVAPPPAVQVTAPLRTEGSPSLPVAERAPLAPGAFPGQSQSRAAESQPQGPWTVGLREWAGERLPWVSALWLAGVAVLSLRLLVRWWGLREVGKGLQAVEPQWQELLASLWRQVGMSRPVRVVASAAARVPMVLGWLRPVIVLPASALTGLTAEQLAALLGHELAHLRRHDQWVNFAQTLIELLLFYHPAVWWVSERIRAEREHCCDDAAVGLCGSPAAYLRALAWVEEHRGQQLRPAISASGPPLLGRIRRLAGYPAPAEIRPAWLAAVLALAMALAVPLAGSISRAPSDAQGHTAGQRVQWQPQITEGGYDLDRRLEQRVQIEILGRAAIPALELLSEKTGVSLQVAPEDPETVGERKLTIIAQGCSLKAIMVWIPTALQECHWDIVTTGPQPVYLLHRNGGAGEAMTRLAEEQSLRYREERRPAREARLAEARRALAMSPEELDELAKSDPLLVASVKDPETRRRLQLLLGLPAKHMQEFVATGRAYLEYASAPRAYQGAADQAKESFLKDAAKSEHASLRAWAKVVPELLPQAGICFEDYEDNGISFLLQYYDTKGAAGRKGDVLRAGGGSALPPRVPDDHSAKYWFRPLLLKTGYDEKAADAVLADLSKQRAEQEQQKREEKRVREWREPRSPQLHNVVALPFKDNVDKVEMQRFIARETGLSLVSDYFTTWGSGEIPEEAKAGLPLWRVLYLLGDSWFWSYDWNEAGDCLVFHDRNWYTLAPQEFPESMVLAYREKLKQRGRFTLDDVAAAAVELARRRPVPPRQRGAWPWASVNVPSDLEQAGLWGHQLRSEALLLYASLSPEQRDKARRAEGLRYQDMTGAQQELVRPYAFFTGGWNHDKHPIPDEEIAKAVFCIKQSSRGSGSEARELFELGVEFPSLQEGTTLGLRPAKPRA